MRSLGWLCIVVGGMIILVIRPNNLDLSEGRLFVEFWEWWSVVLCLVLVGAGLIVKDRD